MDVRGDQADLALLLERSDVFPVYKHYQPLDKTTRSIRLLQIWYESNGEIHAAITHASLDDQVEYEALSYCWGPPDIPKTIYIGQEALLIRSSLHGFLDALCQKNQSLPVWVDAICINQRDVHERNWQVSMMGDIYRHAARVKSWIGPSDGHSEHAFAYINHYHNKAFLSSPIYERIQRKAHESFQIMLDRPYWKRLWIVQEMALARELFILCGSRTVSWNVLLDAYKHDISSPKHVILALDGLRRDLDEGITLINDPSTRASDLSGYVNRCNLEEDEFTIETNDSIVSRSPLLAHMSSFAGQACEDPRDRIFGLLSMANDGRQLVVDYKKSLADVLMGVVLVTYHTSLTSRGRMTTDHEDITFRQEPGGDSEDSVDLDELRKFASDVRIYLRPTKLLTNPQNLLCTLSNMEKCPSIRTRLRPQPPFSRSFATEVLQHKPVFFNNRDEDKLADKSFIWVFTYDTSIFIQWDSHEAAPQLIGFNHNFGASDVYSVLLQFGEIQLCSRVQPSQGCEAATCDFFLHLSPFAILASICFGIYSSVHEEVQAVKACLGDRRKRYPRPRLCTCEVSAELSPEVFAMYEREKMRQERGMRGRMRRKGVDPCDIMGQRLIK